MTFRPRPHSAPCACEECCTWAREVISTPTERKPPRVPQLTEKPDMPMAQFMADIVKAACKATGLTEEQLRARAAEMDLTIPETKPERDSRMSVLNRGVPEIHVKSVYDAVPDKCQAIDAVSEFVGSTKTVLVLAGGVGTCKTGSACWALTFKPGRFCTADEAVRLSTSNATEDVDLWRRVRNAQLLVIDDLGGEYSGEKGWGVKVFNGLLDHRYSHGLKTIITTNLAAHKFKQDYGERVADRIRETGRFLTLGGTSVRKKAS
jgi:hypothetical protein